MSAGQGVYSLTIELVADCGKSSVAPWETAAERQWGSGEFCTCGATGRGQAVSSWSSSSAIFRWTVPTEVISK